jgi:hypothetical protein
VHSSPMDSKQRDALSWLYLGMMIATETREWPAELPPAYFQGLEQLARAVRDGDATATSAQLRAKFPALSYVADPLKDDPVAAVDEAVTGDALLCEIGRLADRCETRRDGAFDVPALVSLRGAIDRLLARTALEVPAKK